MRTVGVVGAGVMGAGLAQTFAQANLRVVLLDVSQSILDRARAEIRQNMRLQQMLRRDARAGGAAETLSRIGFTTDYGALRDADFVIESVTENWGVKREVLGLLDAACPAHAVFASNTSAIPITRLASATARPAQVIGTHFMNPAPLKPVVEVIRGFHTSDETVGRTFDLLALVGKEAVVVNDSPGFVSNRVLMLTVNEAVFLLQDQVAGAEDIDRIFRSCFGHKMGPLETADLIGLDTILYSLEVLYENFNDPKFRPCPLLRKLVDAGLHGRKSGRGFYNYEQATPFGSP
ncbi:MAG TPA: 3-hydroxyacyl-CoA dehydrogenase NAD-binding domain-containing protein [Pyrinomonadaceae bacterium]